MAVATGTEVWGGSYEVSFSLIGRRGLLRDGAAADESLSRVLRDVAAAEATLRVLRDGVAANEALTCVLRDGVAAEAPSRVLGDGGAADEARGAADEAPGSGSITEERLLKQLLASFDRREDPELVCWNKGKGSRAFYLFKLKASAKDAQLSFWKKKYARFSPERPGYTAALRVARLGTDGIHLEQAGEGGHPGALSYQIAIDYMNLQPPKGPFLSETCELPLREVALIRRLPRGDGISIMSRVKNLGIQLREVLFLLPCCSATVALTFTDPKFYVTSRFTEEPVYARVGLNFVNITEPVENLIKKLNILYEEEQQAKKVTHEAHDEDWKKEQERERVELKQQKEEQEREKRESLQKRRAESKKCKCMRKEVKNMIGKVKPIAKTIEEPEEDGCLFSLLFLSLEESQGELFQSEEMHMG